MTMNGPTSTHQAANPNAPIVLPPAGGGSGGGAPFGGGPGVGGILGILLVVGLFGVGGFMLPRLLRGSPEPAATATADVSSDGGSETDPTAEGVDLVVQSAVEGAMVSFRSEEVTLPFHATVESSEVPEPISVVAPGRQGRVFWVKLDRARQLIVELPSGSGLSEANWDETQRALNAKALAKVTKDTSSGGVAGSSKPFIKRVRTPAPKAKTAPTAAETAPPSTAETPVATTAPTTKPTAPATKPTNTKVAVAPAPKPKTPGVLAKKQVSGTIKQHRSEIQACYDRAHMDQPNINGAVTVSARVTLSGTVVGARATRDTTGSSVLTNCLIGAFSRWSFPRPTGETDAPISYTFKFQ